MSAAESIIPTTESTLPVKAVTLFSSGVAYILREGKVSAGEDTVHLTFRTAQVNDILKSMVVLDSAGQVQAATLPTRDPVTRSLQSFAVDVTDNLSRADLMRKLRGVLVIVETIHNDTITGRIVSTEKRAEVSDGRTIAIETLSLLGDDGLRSVDLPQVRLVRLLDARLDREFREALAVLASGSDDNHRTVTLTFAGAEARSVQVGYIAEAPLWKVSYRLVLDDKERPYLQGWAMVENTSEDDWEQITLSLVSGRPISFIQDLYQPLYVPRPVVPPDIIASPYPQSHAGSIEKPRNLMVASLGGGMSMQDVMEEEMDDSTRFAIAASRSVAAPAARMKAVDRAKLQETTVSQAEGKQSGELFEYNINTPVSLPRQQAALIPIVSGHADGEKLSLYNADNDSRFPLNAFRLKNTTGLHLKGGPLTVFDDGIYAGDARMEDIAPDDSRLITYAVDLAIEGERQNTQKNTERMTFTIRRGVLQVKQYIRHVTDYTFKSKAKVERTVLVEHPYYARYALLEPATYIERTADRYRFAVIVPPGQNAALTVTQEETNGHTVTLVDATLTTLSAYTSNGELSPELLRALSEVSARRQRIEETMNAATQADRQRETIFKDQERIRANMVNLDHASTLYQRYLSQLEQQENQLVELASNAERLRQEADTLTSEYKTYIDSLEFD